MRVEDGHQPEPYPVWKPYETDLILPALLERLLPQDVFDEIEKDLLRFQNEALPSVKEASALMQPPTLTQYDQWGRRIDKLQTSEGWRKMKEIVVREGLVAIPHERKHGEYSRIHAFAKYFIMSGDSQVIMCPYSMTDGSARVLELFGTVDMKEKILPRLTSRDPNIAITSGQWMTEKTGGSDVSQTETIAKPNPGSSSSTYRLNGFKWFSSATDADMAVALARTGTTPEGSRGLSLFLVPMRFPFVDGYSVSTKEPSNNGIHVHRLKDKLGTKIVPTAELSIDGAEGHMIGRKGEGVKTITPVLNITRMHSASGSVSALGRALSIARSYSTVRAINGGKVLLQDVPIHTNTLAKVGLLYRALMAFLFGTIHLLGKDEAGTATPDEQLRLRVSTSTLKAFAADKAVGGMEECMAALGGQGYMEENVIPRLIRDNLVEKIWEGTINVLALDFIRAANRPTQEAIETWIDSIISEVSTELSTELKDSLRAIREAKEQLFLALSPPIHKLIPRSALILFGYLSSTLYLLEHAIWSFQQGRSEKGMDIHCVNLWVSEGLSSAVTDVQRILGVKNVEQRIAFDRAMLYGAKL